MNLISIAIPTFNRRDRVLRALESVFQQTYRPIEVIVVDDCSTDGTVEYLSGCAFPEPVNVVTSEMNRGPSAARNAAIDRAHGRYIAFLDSDDRWLPDKLTHQFQWLQRQPSPDTTLVYSQVYLEREYETIIRPAKAMRTEDVAEYIFCNGGHINSSNIMLPTSVVQAIRYDERLRLHEDWDLYQRLQKHGITFSFLSEPLSVTDDRGSTGRASAPRPAASIEWLDHRKDRMSPRAYFALRAKIAPQLRSVAPWSALRYILAAYSKRAISTWFLLSLLGHLVHPELRQAAYRVRGMLHCAV